MHEEREGLDEATRRGWRWAALGGLALVGVVVGLFVAGQAFERGPFAPSFPGPLPVEVVDGTPDANGNRDSPAEYFLRRPSAWELLEAVDPDEDWQFAGIEPSLDWYAEYEYMPSPELSQGVRLSGHLATLEGMLEELPGFDPRPVEVRGGDGLAGGGREGAPSVILFEARGGYVVMVLSYDLDAEQLVPWTNDLRRVTEQEWVAAGGVVGNPSPFMEE